MDKKVVKIGIILAVIAILVIVGILIGKYFYDRNPKHIPFSQQDLTIGEITYQTTVEELIEKLGNPSTRKEYIEGATGDKIVECLYEENTSFMYRDSNQGEGLRLAYVNSNSKQYTFARELKIGFTKQQVFDAFPDQFFVENNENQIKVAKDTKSSMQITFILQQDVVIQILWNI